MRDPEGLTTPRDLTVPSRLAHGYLVLVGLWLLVLGLFNVAHPSDWAMGDWLINYSGGFVRRGLIGEIALLLKPAHIAPLWSVLALQWALYGIVLFNLWRLVTGLRWRWWTLAFLFSPATLAFVLLDPPFAFRKEILLFALLACTLGGAPEGPVAKPMLDHVRLILLLSIGCAVCILSHEALIVFFPYIFAALALRLRDLRRAASVFAIPVLVSVVLFALVSHYPGNAGTARAICDSIGGQITSPPSGICGGAIDYLAHDAGYAHRQVAHLFGAGRSWALILWLFLLPLLPAALGLRQLWRTVPHAARVIAGCSAVAWCLSISVFYYGTDWTRWIYIHSFCLMLLMLFAARQADPLSAPATSASGQTSPRYRWVSVALLLLYCFGWELTVYSQRPLYASFVRFVTHNMARGR